MGGGGGGGIILIVQIKKKIKKKRKVKPPDFELLGVGTSVVLLTERRLLHINFVSYKILEKHKPTVPDDLTGTSDVIKSIFLFVSVCIEMFYV